MNEVEMELSWLVYMATRESWMGDSEHKEAKRNAWAKAKAMAADKPEKFGALPAMLVKAMTGEPQRETA